MTAFVLVLATLAGLWLGVVGTGTEMAFLWPGLFALGLAAFIGALPRLRFEGRTSHWCSISALLVVCYFAWRASVSDVSYFGRQDLLLIVPCFSIYALFAIRLVRVRHRLIFVGLLLALVVGNVATAFYQRVFDAGFAVIPGYRRDVGANASPGGFYNNHTHFAGFLGMVAQYALALILFGRMRLPIRLLLGLVGLLACSGLVLSMSRGALVSASVGFLVVGVGALYLARMLHREIFGKIAIASGLIAVVGFGCLAFFGYGALSERFNGEFFESDGDLKSTGRTAYWEAAWTQFEGAPVIGEGARSFSYHFNKNYPENFWTGSPTPRNVHNDYLQTLAEYGVVGGILLFTFALFHFCRGARYLRWFRNERFPKVGSRSSNDVALALGSLGAVACCAVHSVVDFNMHLLANASVMAFVFGVLAAPSRPRVRQRKEQKPLASSGLLLRRASMALAGLAVLALGVRYASVDERMRRGESAMVDRDEPTAITNMHRVVEDDPENFRAPKTLAVLRYLKLSDEDVPLALLGSYVREALEGFEETLKRHPYDYGSMVYAGRCETFLGALEPDQLGRKRSFERSQSFLEEASYWAPLRYEPHDAMGELLRARALDAEIEEDLESALSLAIEARDSFSFSVSRTAMKSRKGSTQWYGQREMAEVVSRLKLALASQKGARN